MSSWTITKLYNAMQKDLLLCGSDFERSMVRAICGPEIRLLAASKTTPLSDNELQIAKSFGYKENGNA
jgi:hypothetical protein